MSTPPKENRFSALLLEGLDHYRKGRMLEAVRAWEEAYTLEPSNLRIFAHVMIARFRPVSGRLLVQLPTGHSPGPLVTEVEQLGAQLHAVEVGQEGDRRNVALDLALPQGADIPAFVAKVADVEQVLDVQWMR